MLNVETREALEWMVGILTTHSIPYQISGGLAAKFYGSKRPLNDIDIDVSRADIDFIASLTQQYITFGPARYIDEKWNLYLLTLRYQNQEIDIGEQEGTKLYIEKAGKWVGLDNSRVETLQIPWEGVLYNVIHPQELINYKSLLNGDHQKEDIAAARQYLNRMSHNI